MLGAVLSGPAVLGIQTAQDCRRRRARSSLWATWSCSVSRVAYLVRLVEERARVEHLALHDDLTGLPEPSALQRPSGGGAGRTRSAAGESVALLFLDLDRFKTINDSLGHAAGNDLLRARRPPAPADAFGTTTPSPASAVTSSRSCCAEVDGAAAAGVVAEKILAMFAEPFKVAKRELFVSPSIGIALSPSDGAEAAALLKNADTAMYRAKERGRNNYQLYTADMNAQGP